MPKLYTGINIQYPISSLILEGAKIVETRTYPIPKKYLGIDLLVIETPGDLGSFKSRIIAIVRFDKCYQYNSKKDFTADFRRHRVEDGSVWDWKSGHPKWAWEISYLKKIEPFRTFTGRKGIVYTRNISF